MPKAEKALRSAPGVLAVEVDYEQKRGIIGTQAGTEVNTEKIFAALEEIGYRGKLADESAER